MTVVLLYGNAVGIYSSRRIGRACQERVDFMALTGMQKPDFRTISLFRLRHLEALKGLFKQVLKLCRKAGMVKLGHVALDGSKIRANASSHKSMSDGGMIKAERELKAEVDRWFDEAERIDREEDELYGVDKGGDGFRTGSPINKHVWRKSDKPKRNWKLKRKRSWNADRTREEHAQGQADRKTAG